MTESLALWAAPWAQLQPNCEGFIRRVAGAAVAVITTDTGIVAIAVATVIFGLTAKDADSWRRKKWGN